MLKIARYSESLDVFHRVLRRKRDQLAIAGVVNLLLLVVSSSVVYLVEHEAQPEAFSSIPQAMWWGIVTLTTVGYGDVHPVTPVGQFFGAFVALLGVAVFALPASILASGFVEEAQSDEQRTSDSGQQDLHSDTPPQTHPTRQRTTANQMCCPHCGQPVAIVSEESGPQEPPTDSLQVD